MPVPRGLARCLTVAAIACFTTVLADAASAAELTVEEIQQISRFDRSPSLRDTPASARAEMEPRAQAAYRDARALFSGRGTDVARHFLTHTGYPPANEAYFFVLEAIADTETALALIRALWDPPEIISGPEIRTGGRAWLLERNKSDIYWAIVSVLVNETVRSDPRLVPALLETVERLRPKDRRLGAGDAGTAVELLGRCTSAEATAALQKLAEDSDSTLRGLAVQGLGQSAGAARPADAATTLSTVARTLRTDPDPRARIEAAAALGKIGSADGIAPLRAALEAERDPQVVDAIVLGLGQLKAPFTDPKACGEIVARTWEAHAARAPFACWRTGATQETLQEAAISGPAQLRALALYALVERAAEYRPQPYLIFTPQATAPPPPLAPPGAKATISAPRGQPGRPPQPPRIEFDAATRERLLVSAVDVLSRPSAGIPGKHGEISSSIVLLVRDAMWEIADRNMVTALRYADRISTRGARYVMQGRYGASYDLWHKDRAAYLDYRRPRQAAVGALLAGAFGLLLAWKRARRAGASLVTAALAWIVWSLFVTQLRELPPPPLQLMTLTAIAFISAGVSVAAMALMSQGNAPGGAAKAVGLGSAAIGIAAVLAFLACGITRWYDVFPIGGEGWELIFDPIGSAIVAAMAATVLALLDRVAFRRLFTP